MQSRIAFKRRIGQLYKLLKVREAQRNLILLYHSIGGGAEAIATEMFRGHLGVISAIGHFTTLRDILGSSPDCGIAVAITFDDGYATLRDRAMATLMEFGATATAFLNIGEIADDERRSSRIEDGYYPGEQFLTWQDVNSLLAAGWQIGSHGVRHLNLARTEVAVIKLELSASKLIIEQHLGSTCDMFAYPWGHNNAHLRSEVRSAGYRYGFAGGHSAVTSKSDRLALPRINVAKEYSRDDLAAILRGDWDYLKWVAKAKAVTQ